MRIDERKSMKPQLNQRVTLNTLLCEGDFPGMIVDINPLTFLCKVKLDRQEELVTGVMYYKEPPIEVRSSLWQICYPIGGNHGSTDKG